MKFRVHFATYGQRVNYLDATINSWRRQSLRVEDIVITTPQDMTTALLQYNTTLQILNTDYGPNNKVLGALKYYENSKLDDVYMIICDDDIIYDENTVKVYQESLEKDKTKIYTHFRGDQRLKNINHLQGADTYLLTPEFFRCTSFEIYENYLKEVIRECPEAMYQDDYVIAYFIYTYCHLEIATLPNRKMYRLAHQVNQLHHDPRLREREEKTTTYFNSKLS